MNQSPTTLHTPFGNVFAVQSGIPVRDAQALCAEAVDADLRQMRSLVAMIHRELEMGEGLLEASLRAFNG